MMKIKFTRPARNRKFLKDLDKSRRKRLMNAHLSSELREELKTRSLPLRPGDTVRVVRGKNKGLVKKVLKVSLKKNQVQIEGIKTTKTDSTEIFHWIEPSNLIITQISQRGERKEILERIAEANSTKEE